MSDRPEEFAYSWPTPNYVDPVTRGHTLTVISSILIFAAAVAIGLRYVSHYLYSRWGPDDICIFLAWLMALGLVICDNIVTQRWGWNRHIWDVPPAWFHMSGLYSWVAKLFYTTAACFTRLSILAFYYRLVEGATWTKSYRRVLHAALAGVIILYLITIFLAIFLCIPVQSYWGVRSVGACRPESRELFATSAASCVCDFMLLCLPLPIIWQLQMSVRKRVQAIALLSVGLIACASSGVRTYYVWHLFHSSQDTSWNAYPIYFTSDLEIILGIICACTPHIKPLAKRWFGKKNATMVQERHEAAEQRIKEPKSAASPDVESLDFITEATPHQ